MNISVYPRYITFMDKMSSNSIDGDSYLSEEQLKMKTLDPKL